MIYLVITLIMKVLLEHFFAVCSLLTAFSSMHSLDREGDLEVVPIHGLMCCNVSHECTRKH